MTKLICILMLALPLNALAVEEVQKNIIEDFDNLGGNAILLEKAKALNPEVESTIVQNRMVERRKRFEVAPEAVASFGGDTYSRTHGVGFNVGYHINPRWSLGVKYYSLYNRLTAEGEAMVDRAWAEYQKNPKEPGVEFPEMDYPRSETMALAYWYPVYGKLNLLDKKIAQFDAYLMGGIGSVILKSGATQTRTAGGGVGFWLSPKVSARVEVRYENYKAQYYTGEKNLDLAIGSLQMGWLL